MTINLTDLKTKAEAATQGEWGVYAQPIADRQQAIDELAAQVSDTEQLADALYLLNADGKCPATTGCGPTSQANAAYIAAASPAAMLPLINALIEWRDAWTNMEDNWRTTNRIGEAHDALLALISGKPTQETTP